MFDLSPETIYVIKIAVIYAALFLFAVAGISSLVSYFETRKGKKEMLNSYQPRMDLDADLDHVEDALNDRP